jgi:hypothetical protein
VSFSLLGPLPSTDHELMQQFSAFLASKGQWRGKNIDKAHYTSSARFLYQLCQKTGHTADRCYKRFDHTYKPPPPRQSSKYASRQQASPQALFVQPGQPVPESWYLDSGASAHVSPDLNAFTSYTPYTGTDKLCVGNGKGLDISHIGSGILLTPSVTLKLQNILHVPDISKPLLSISQLLTDNAVYVQFNSNSCFIKDQASNKIILQLY